MFVAINTESQRFIDAFERELKVLGLSRKIVFDIDTKSTVFINPKNKSYHYTYPPFGSTSYYTLPKDWDKIFSQIEKELQPDYEEGEWVWVDKGWVYNCFRYGDIKGEKKDALVKYTKKGTATGFNHAGEWTELFGGSLFKKHIKRKATKEEVKEKLIEEAKRRDIWDKPIKEHADGDNSKIVINDRGFCEVYNLEGDALWSKNRLIYYQGKWAEKISEISDNDLEKGKYYATNDGFGDRLIFRYTKTSGGMVHGDNSAFIDDPEEILPTENEDIIALVNDPIRPATDKEVEKALILIAKELGYKDGTEIRYSVFDIATEAYKLKEPFMLGYNYEAGYFLYDKENFSFYADIEGWPEKVEEVTVQGGVWYEVNGEIELYVNGVKQDFPCTIHKGDEIGLKGKV